MSIVSRAAQLPKNYPAQPARYPVSIFRLELEAAKRYLFEGELKDALTAASIPLDVLTGAGEPVVNVAQISHFMQELREMVGDEKSLAFGREAFHKVAAVLPRASGSTSAGRTVSSSDKVFLKVRDSIAALNKQVGCNFIVKWHGGAEADLFEDTAQHCYGFSGKGLACATMTGFIEEAIIYLSGVRIKVTESECMAQGALACRWHCKLS